MDSTDFSEFHYIVPIRNLASIFKRGVLSHSRALKLKHESVAMLEIQEKREVKSIPGGKKLHDYANFYFNARNPMMYRLQHKHLELAVLQIDKSILEIPDVVIADGNASSKWTAFWPVGDGLIRLDKSTVYIESWTDPDTFEYWRKKRMICAEVLVPDVVPVEYIIGMYTSGNDSEVEAKKVAKQISWLKIHGFSSVVRGL